MKFRALTVSEVRITVHTNAGVVTSVTSPDTFTMTLFVPEAKNSVTSTEVTPVELIYICRTTT